MVPGAEETTEFATEEEESLEEVANNSNMAAALLLVDCPESCSLRREEKASSRSGENERRNCLTENCLGDEPPHYETQENASCRYAKLHYATIHKHV